ncbi:FAD/NAD(P)-binding protein [Sphingomonas montanisoli]|uniref:NAD(P)/FAD-dependent oxidoreductase n=1 Tax=Sphingomonas montanisoli TaxID=2606412 RepID=A0A5D9CCM7_9SPHN|nr:NAD(P)/FAD-dependent oxidoreductase [Sphingomonas montanisoli]TZG27855.1 NAD(P)/FAD-dependent oxidoreductase [Sphingomonas montanisoli]
MSLDDLNAQVAADLTKIEAGKPTWVRETRGVYDVVIVGGGQSGLGAAFGLIRERMSNILIIDENPAGYEGPWDTYARMVTLRTPKEITSIDLGIPSLTFRSFWEAQHGAEGWAAIDKIPRGDWMEYLRWYRAVLSLPVENETRLTLLDRGSDGHWRLSVEGPGGERTMAARKVILATGIQGGGEWHTPDLVKHLPRDRYAHTSEAIDFATLAGKRIAILGAGASSFDNAQHALSHGVAEAHVFVRRKALPQVNPIRFMERWGMTGRFAALDDAAKYRVMASFFARNQPPTNDTFQRAAAWPGFRLHLGAPWLSVREADGEVIVETPEGHHGFDFLILSTGLITDPKLRPELALLAEDIARWRDRYEAPADLANPLIDDHPYLGPGFQLQGSPKLHGLFAFNYSGLISLGLSASALSGLKYAIPRLVEGVANQLFLDDQEAALTDYLAYDEPEFVSTWEPR